MGWAYRLSGLRSPGQILRWAGSQLPILGVAMILCVPTALLMGRGIRGTGAAGLGIFLLLGVGGAIALTLLWIGFWIYRGRQLTTLNHLLDEIDRFHEILQAIEILDELQTVNPQRSNLENRETVLEALYLNRESLICALKTEAILRKHQRFILRRQDLFASIEHNLTTLKTFQIDAEANEYSRLLNQALQIGTSVYDELRQLS